MKGATRRRLLLPAPALLTTTCRLIPSAMSLCSPKRTAPYQPGRHAAAGAAFRPVSLVRLLTRQRHVADLVAGWEGVLPSLSRYSGRLLGDGSMTDLNGLYCSYGVEDGDKLRLRGCQSDADCAYLGTTVHCQRDAGQGTAPGLCLTNDQAMACRAAARLSSPIPPAMSAGRRAGSGATSLLGLSSRSV